MRDLGDPGAARPLVERAVAITETAYAPDHPYIGALRATLATIMRDLGEVE